MVIVIITSVALSGRHHSTRLLLEYIRSTGVDLFSFSERQLQGVWGLEAEASLSRLKLNLRLGEKMSVANLSVQKYYLFSPQGYRQSVPIVIHTDNTLHKMATNSSAFYYVNRVAKSDKTLVDT